MDGLEEPSLASNENPENCGYCGDCVDHTHNILPLICSDCNKCFHVYCLTCEKPPSLLGDQLFRFYCTNCSTTGRDVWERPFLSWVHIIHLALYNLLLTERGKDGFFRWNTQICKFIETQWSSLMPMRQKTASWKCTVAGILSVNCPSIFRSGTQILGESGWWSLQKITPPSWKDVVVALANDRTKKHYKMADDNNYSSEVVVMDKPLSSKKHPLSDNNNDDDYYNNEKKVKIESNEFFDYSSLKETVSSDTNYQPIRFSVNQEDNLIEHLNKHIRYYGIRTNPTKARLYRKLRLRQRKRQLGFKIFDIDEHYKTCIRPIKHYKAEEDFDNPVPVLAVNTIGKADMGVANPIVGEANPIMVGADLTTITDRTDSSQKAEGSIYDTRMIERAMSIQSRLSLPLMPVLLVKGIFNNTNTATLMPVVKTFTSSYTSRLLKPVIFQSYDFTPTKLKVLTELTNRVSSRQNTVTPSNTINPYSPHPITFCYFGEHHLASVNAMISHFFWPVNLKEYLQYPDFTVIVQYGKLVIGCGFMTPDVKVSEAYIPFLLVHPDFCGCGLGKVMLYHLIQSCQGKDVTLHVSIDNPAMLLYQQFGFKAELFCIDFYNKYYPPSYSLSKHAFLMRLRR